MDAKALNAILCAFLVLPLAGSIAPPSVMTLDEPGLQLIEYGQTTIVPAQAPVTWDNPGPWWGWASLDADRNGIHDSLQTASGPVNVGLSYDRPV
ncbi:MAG: hypothetical protein CMA33_01865, partial [Euryarchaeota archaeon]|nr:hypothetical protein [Euryarchaeota archaeon]